MNAQKKPNLLLFIMGNDIGWMQPRCYPRGLMVGETPNIDRIANEGGIFMSAYAESGLLRPGARPSLLGMTPMRAGVLMPQFAGRYSISYLRPWHTNACQVPAQPGLYHWPVW